MDMPAAFAPKISSKEFLPRNSAWFHSTNAEVFAAHEKHRTVGWLCPQKYFRAGLAAGCAAWLCLAGGQQINAGCARFGLCPNNHGPKAVPGAQPHLLSLMARQGKASPHIRRQSRKKVLLGQSCVGSI